MDNKISNFITLIKEEREYRTRIIEETLKELDLLERMELSLIAQKNNLHYILRNQEAANFPDILKHSYRRVIDNRAQMNRELVQLLNYVQSLDSAAFGD